MKHLVPFNTPISEDLIKTILLYVPISQLFLYEAKCDQDIKVLYFSCLDHLCFGVEIYKTYIQEVAFSNYFS